MDAGFHLVFTGDARHQFTITGFSFIQGNAVPKRSAVTSHKIIEHDDLFAICSQAFHRHASDVACPTGNKNRHELLRYGKKRANETEIGVYPKLIERDVSTI
jgi:hypothetical protein